MLEKHLIAETHPIANCKNIIFWQDYRVTVLTDRLFRIEKNNEKIFRDDATQVVWFRNTKPQAFTIYENQDGFFIKTERCKLCLKRSIQDCCVEIDGKKVPLNNTENLKGTYRTLDRCNGNRYIPSKLNKNGREYDIELNDGVCSKNGVAVFDDAKSLSLDENGEVLPVCGKGEDLYVFAYGNDYKNAVKALYLICGAVPVVPRFALGNWWSRYHEYTDKEYLRLLQKFENHNVPLTVATIDMDWHYSVNIDEELGITKSGKNTPYYVGEGSMGWTGYTWNKNLFPNYKKFLAKVKEKGVKITLNLHPADGVRWWEVQYKEMAKALGLDCKSEKQIPFDFTNTKFINAYFSVLHKPYEADGVDFWWIDWQQGEKSNIAGLDPLWALNHYHYYDNKTTGNPLILSRYAGIGSHRYPLGFSGDTHITWETLDYLPYFTLTASNVGYTWWSHDIGGHMQGEVNGELYLRHIQFGVFSPINRLHSSDAKVTTKEAWYYGNGIGKIAMDWLRFRHSMIPFLYTCSVKAHTDGVALIEPLYYYWQDDEAYEFKNEYLFGEQMLVAPITKPSKDGFSSVKVWIPKGVWTDIFTGDEYTVETAKTVEMYRDLESIPVLAKSGAILPFSGDSGNSCKNPKRLNMRIYSGNGEFTLYEDGLENGDDRVFKTNFTLKESELNGTVTSVLEFFGTGEAEVIPTDRIITLYFENIKDGTVCVKIDNEPYEVEELYEDCVSVKLPFMPEKKYTVTVVYDKQTPLKKAINRMKEILLGTEMNNTAKNESFEKIEKVDNLEDFKIAVLQSVLPEKTKKRLLEII